MPTVRIRVKLVETIRRRAGLHHDLFSQLSRGVVVKRVNLMCARRLTRP